MKTLILSAILLSSLALAEELKQVPSGDEIGTASLVSTGEVARGMPKVVNFSREFLLDSHQFGAFLYQSIESMEENFSLRNLSGGHSTTPFSHLKKLFSGKYFNRVFAVKDERELIDYCPVFEDIQYPFPEGGQLVKVSCSANGELYLVEDIFLRMNRKTQFLVILREMLASLRDRQGGINPQEVAGVVAGADMMLRIRFEQQQGRVSLLSTSEVKKLDSFYRNFLLLSSVDNDLGDQAFNWRIHPNGGAVIHRSSVVAEDAFVGTGMNVGAYTIIEKGAHLKEFSHLPANSQIGKFTKLEKVKFSGFRNVFTLGDKSILSNVEIWFTDLNIGEGVLVNNSSFKNGKIKLEASVLVENSKLLGDLDIGNRVEIKNSQLDFKLHHELRKFSPLGSYTINAFQKIESGKLSAYSSIMYAPKGAIVTYPNDVSYSIDTPCLNYDPSEGYKYHQCLKTDFDSQSERDADLIRPLIFQENGLKLTMLPKFKKWRVKKPYDGKWEHIVAIRKYQISLQFSSDEAEKGIYVLYDGKVLPAGIKVFRKLYVKKNENLHNIVEALSATMQAGIMSERDFYVRIPFMMPQS